MKYPSRYSGDKLVTAAQYITELICEKKAKVDGKDLHYRFWLNKEWEKFYRSQIGTANKLLTKYDAVVVIKSLRDNKCKNTYSLRAPFLKNVLEEHQKIHNSKTYDLTLEIDRTEKTRFRKTKIVKNTLSRLREIDDGN